MGGSMRDTHLVRGEIPLSAVLSFLFPQRSAISMGFPSHFLWYHYGPLEAHNALGEYQKVSSLSEEVGSGS
jgi:hypothetical protein